MPVDLSTQMLSTIGKVRRRINDIDPSVYLYTDEELYGYVGDAVDHLEMNYFKRGRTVDGGDFVLVSSNHMVLVPPAEQNVYAIQATILITTSIKSKADRDNFSLRKPNLSVDTSRQSSDHAETLSKLEGELHSHLFTLSSISGARHSGDDA